MQNAKKKKSIKTLEEHSLSEVPDVEVTVILDCLCQFIKDTYRVKEQVSEQFKDDRLKMHEDQLTALSDRLWTSLDALEVRYRYIERRVELE
jgi:hypothetical protein